MNVNTSTLPVNIFDLQHDEFYNFIELHYGPIQAKILKLQLISDASIFAECNDPTEILQYSGEKLNELKNKACLITNDGNCIILPGIAASFKTLKKRLLKKLEEDVKKTKKNNSTSFTQPNAPTVNQAKSIEQLRTHLITIIRQWYNNHRDEFNLKSESTLVESVDYQIEFRNESNGDQSACIICQCGARSTLCRTVNNGFYQASNFYRHLERRNCSIMLKKLIDETNVEQTDQNNIDNNILSNDSTALVPSSLALTQSSKTLSRKRGVSNATHVNNRSIKRRRTKNS
ncbi:unnamed protein product [Rotaria socialis]